MTVWYSYITIGKKESKSFWKKVLIKLQTESKRYASTLALQDLIDSKVVRIGTPNNELYFVKEYCEKYLGEPYAWSDIIAIGAYAIFGNVIINDGSYVTGNCLITPNTNIGIGATVLANSLVTGKVEDYSVNGIPVHNRNGRLNPGG